MKVEVKKIFTFKSKDNIKYHIPNINNTPRLCIEIYAGNTDKDYISLSFTKKRFRHMAIKTIYKNYEAFQVEILFNYSYIKISPYLNQYFEDEIKSLNVSSINLTAKYQSKS